MADCQDEFVRFGCLGEVRVLYRLNWNRTVAMSMRYLVSSAADSQPNLCMRFCFVLIDGCL